MREEAFRQQVRGIARMFGWMMYHTYDSRRSDPGFPDEVFAHPQRKRVLFVEFKNEKGKLTQAQWNWLNALAVAGQEVAVWRPQQMDRIRMVLDAGNRSLLESYWLTMWKEHQIPRVLAPEQDGPGWEFPEHLSAAISHHNTEEK